MRSRTGTVPDARRPLRWAVVACALALVAAGCGGGSSPVAPNDATGVVMVAASKTIKAGTSKMSMNGAVTAGESSFSIGGDGAFDFKSGNGSMTVRLTGDEIPDAFGGFDLLFVSRVLYMKFPPQFSEFLPGLKPWIRMDLDQFAKQASVPGLSSFTSQDPTSALNFLRGADRVTLVGRESIRGDVTTHYRMTIDVAKARDAFDDSARAGWEALIQKTGLGSFPMEVWIDAQGRARRLHFTMGIDDLGSISGAEKAGKPGTMNFTTDLFDFGTPVTVAVPAADQVSDYAELAKLGGAAG